jgi:hypothetical protein
MKARAGLRKTIARVFRPDRLLELTLLIDGALLILLLLFAAMPQTATFTLRAKTERAVVELPVGEKAPNWAGLAFADMSGARRNDETCKTGALSLGDVVATPLRVTFTSQPAGVSVDVTAQNGKSVGDLECEDGSGVTLGDQATATIAREDAAKLTLPFSGHLTIGALPAEGTMRSPLLLEGVVDVQASSFPFSSGRAQSQSTLQLGETAKVLDRNSKPAQAFGIVRFPDNAMTIVARARGERVEIGSIGQEVGATAALAPTLLDKMRAQPQWAVLILVAALLLNMLGAARAYAASAQRPA